MPGAAHLWPAVPRIADPRRNGLTLSYTNGQVARDTAS